MGRETAPHISNLWGEFMDNNVCTYNQEQRCVESEKIALLEQRVDDLETWKNETKEFHSNFYDWQREQIVMNTRLDERLKGIETSLNKFNQWVDAEQKKPGNFLDTIKSNIAWFVIAAILGYILAQIGLPQ